MFIVVVSLQRERGREREEMERGKVPEQSLQVVSVSSPLQIPSPQSVLKDKNQYNK
jgi:hypothetical protein